MTFFISFFSFQPENILLTDDMHIKLTDFGSGVIVENDKISQTNGNDCGKKSIERKNSFVGTAQFVAPEILQCGPIHSAFVRIAKCDMMKKIFL